MTSKGTKCNREVLHMIQQHITIKCPMDSKIKQYPYLFHRFRESNAELGCTMHMECHQHSRLVLQNRYTFLAHLHCFDMNQFKKYYDDSVMETILHHCSLIIVTFCEGDIGNKKLQGQYSKNIVYLRIENKGMDIGGKCCCLQFLKYRGIAFDFMLFLHSKSCPIRRTMYFRPLIEHLSFLLESFVRHPERGVYVPPLLHCGDNNNRILLMNKYFPLNRQHPWNAGNARYMKELDAFMDFTQNNRYFPEGNCFVCNNDIAQHLYGNMTLYQCLNMPHSLDAVWFSCHHHTLEEMDAKENSNEVVEKVIQAAQKHPTWPKNNLDDGNHGHPDNMLEHAFERMNFKVAQKLGYQVFVIPCSGQKQHIEKTNIYTQQINIFMRKTI